MLILGSIVNAVRPLALILTMLAGCVALAATGSGLADWRSLHPAEIAEGAESQQSCVDDVSVTISSQWGVVERTTYTLKDPPDYRAGDDIGVYYDVTNSSCHNVTVTVELKGSVSKATIHNADATDDMACLEGCTINAGDTLNGNVGWDLSKHPNATGEKVVATVTVDTPSDFSDTDTSNNSATSTQAINIVNEVSTVDIAVKSVTASKTAALIGEEIDFTVTISNEGDAEAGATVTLDHGDDTEELDAAEVVDLAADGESTVTLSWDTEGAEAGTHNLRVLVASDGDGESANDSKTVTVTLSEPSTDVAVTGVEASSTEAVIGDAVVFIVSLENDGDVPVTPSVSLYQGEGTEALGSATASTIIAGGTKTVTISWNTADAEAGTHRVRAVATVADDDDSSNDSATVSVTLHDPVDVELRLTDPLSTSAVKGNLVSVPYTVTNSGANDSGEIVISLYVSEVGQSQTTPQDEAAATTSIAALTANESSSGALTWDTTDANVGDYGLALVATTTGDTDPADNSVTTSIEIRNWLALQSVSPQTSVAVVGEVVEFSAQVQNVGPEELKELTVGLFELKADGALASTTIASIAAGATGKGTIRWDTAGRDVEALDLIVAVGADGQDLDGDDSQFVSIEIRNPIALSSAVPASQDNIAGSSATIDVTLLNESQADATGISVNLHVGDSEEVSSATLIGTVVAGETVNATLTWDTGDAEPGDHQLKVVVSSPDYNADSNDTATLTVALRAPVVAVALTAAAISRDVAAVGQTLDVVATITNHGEVPETAPVSLYLVERLQQTTVASTETSSSIEPGASTEVTLQWDSTGAVLGTHTLKIAAELAGDTTTDDNEEIVEVELFQSAFDGIVDVDSCIEDVGVRVTDVRDRSNQSRSPPDHYVGEKLRATYSIYNFSCHTELKLILTMNGPQGHAISDPDALCFASCLVPFGGKSENDIEWTIPTLPALSDQPVAAAVSVASPSDFVDADEANNSHSSADRINIVHPDDIVLRLRDQTGNTAGAGATLIGPEFGAVDVRLVSAHPIQTSLPFAADTFEVTVAVANDGPTTEPTAVTFVLLSNDGANSRQLHRHTMVIPTGQTTTETVEVPLNGMLPGAHSVEALLSAAVDQSTANNAATFEITRAAPMVNVEMLDVSVSPDVLILGDDATVSLAVHNKSEIALILDLELYVGDEPGPTEAKTLDELAPSGRSEEQIPWRIPAATRMSGPHTLKIVATSGDFGAIATTDIQATLHLDAEIIGINATPAETVMRGEEVTVAVTVQNNGPSTVNVPVTLQFPSEMKQPETRSPPVPAGSTETAQFTWKTRDYAVGDHMLTATVPEQHNIANGETSMELPFQLSPLTITATIDGIAAYPEAPSVGEPVSIAVTVRNDGPIAVNIPITLHFPSGHRQPDTKRPPVGPDETVTVVFEWLTSSYAAGTHQFLVEVAAVDTPELRYAIDLLPTVENLAIIGMGTYPVENAMVGETVEVWVEVRNHGPVALNVPVRLTFPSAGKRPETPSPRVNPGETMRVVFEWKTSNYKPGAHTLRAAILLNNNITVGQTTEEIRFQLTPLVILATILDVAARPDTPRAGDPATITVSVRNDGKIPANIPVTLHYPSGSKQPETRRPRIEAGAVGTIDFTWRTSLYEPGSSEFVVEVASDPPVSQRFAVELLPPIVDVAIVGMGSDPSETAVQGQAVTIWVDVINNGPSALNVPVELSFPSVDKQPERKSPRIAPGETARVEFTWKTGNHDPGDHVLTAVLLVDHNITELDTSATVEIQLISAQLIASIVDVSWRPASPVVGEPVRFTVTVRNGGLVAANIPVTLYYPSRDKQPETRRPRVAPGTVGSAAFTWRTSRYEAGDHLFRVQIPGVAGAVRTFEIELRPPEVDFAVVDFQTPDPIHPIVKGDWVEITVVIRNWGPYAGRGTVYLLDAADLDTMYEQSASLEPGESREVEFTWKTLRYPLGGYELLARVDAEHDTDPDNDQSDHASIHLLTDRDITVGLGSKVRPAVFAEATSKAGLSSMPWYRNDILGVGNGQIPLGRPVATSSNPPMSVIPKPTDGNYDPFRIYWRWRSAQISPWECARYQRETGMSLPRAVACPRAPALIR